MTAAAASSQGNYIAGDHIDGDKVLGDKHVIGGEVISVWAGQHERGSIFPLNKKYLGYPIHIGKKATVNGSVLGKKVDLKSQVRIGGSVCSWGDISIGKECEVRGDVISKRQVFLDAGCFIRNVAAETVRFGGASTIQGSIISLARASIETSPIDLFPKTKVQSAVQWAKGAIVRQGCKLGALFCEGDVRVEDNCEIQCLFTQGDVVLGKNVHVHILHAHDLLVDSANVDYLQCDGSLTVEHSLHCHLLCTHGPQYLKGNVRVNGRSIMSKYGGIDFGRVHLQDIIVSKDHQFWITTNGKLVAKQPATESKGTLISNLLNHTLWQTIEKHVSHLRDQSPWQRW